MKLSIVIPVYDEEETLPLLLESLDKATARWPAKLHYVTAREVFNFIKAAEAGKSGDPNQFRDFILPPPPVARR